jgi:hypothetical protein
MSKFNEVLLAFAEDIVKSARRHIGGRRIGRNKNYGVATGKLKRSLSYKIRVRGDEIREVTFGSKAKHAPYIHWGVNGTQKNQKSPFFNFRKQPPSSVFIPWIKAKGIRLRDEKGKFKKQTESNMNSLAFLIARSVKRKGIVGLRFYEKAYTAVSARYSEKFGEAVVQDLQEKLKLKLGNITVK